MADKPSVNPFGLPGAASSPDLTSPDGFSADVEVRLRSTEKVKLVLQRCERSCAPQHLLIRIRETLITVIRRADERPRSH